MKDLQKVIWSRSEGGWFSDDVREAESSNSQPPKTLLFFFTLVTGHRRSLSLKLSDTRVCEPQIRAGEAASREPRRRPGPRCVALQSGQPLIDWCVIYTYTSRYKITTGALPTGPPLSAKKRSYPHTGSACIYPTLTNCAPRAIQTQSPQPKPPPYTRTCGRRKRSYGRASISTRGTFSRFTIGAALYMYIRIYIYIYI